MRLKTKAAIGIAVALAIPASAGAQVIASYNFGANGASFTYAATTLASNVTASGINSPGDFGANDTFSQDNGVGGTSGFYTNNTGGNYLSVSSAGSTTDNGYWIETIVTAAPGFVINPTSFELVGGAGGASNVRTAYVFDNVDGFPSNIATNPTGSPVITGGNLLASGTFTAVRGTAGPPTMNTIQVTSFPATDVNLTSFTVRAYFDTQGQVGKNIDLGNIELDGSVVSAGPVNLSTWTNSGSGNYNLSANWSSGVPNGIGAEADFLGAISSSNVVYTNTPITLGKVVFDNAAASYSLAGAVGANLTLQTSTGSALVDVSAGTHEINLPLVLASNTTFETDSPASTLVIANPMTINPGVTLTTTGSGTVTYQSIINVQTNAAITFASSSHAHELNLAANSTANIASSTLELDTLSNQGTLNLQSGSILINYGAGADPIAAIAAEIQSGYASGTWTGVGITSTSAQANPGFGIGYADSADPGNPAGLASGTIQIKYTLLGDTDLNAVVNGIDFGILAANFNKGVTGWDKGDFDYNNIVNGIDFGDLAGNFNKGFSGGSAGASAADWAALDAFAAANGLLADVPEPASIGLVTAGALATLARRRTRNNSHPTSYSNSEERTCA